MMRRVATILFGLALAASAPAEPPADEPVLPGIRLDREAGWVELDAKVANREPEWLELLACTPGSLDHESILEVHARPSHIHLALLLLGLEPGHPSRPAREGPNTVVVPPAGPEVRVSLHYEQDGKAFELPGNAWIIDRESGQRLPGDVWLFAGSVEMSYEGKQHYLADHSGTVLTLVNFNDDLLARATEVTRDNDRRRYGPDTDAIPPMDWPVTIRLTPVPADPAP